MLLPIHAILKVKDSLEKRISLKALILCGWLEWFADWKRVRKVIEGGGVEQCILASNVSVGRVCSKMQLWLEGLLDFLNFAAHRIHNGS